jgi:PAS domain S-box-containing protein
MHKPYKFLSVLIVLLIVASLGLGVVALRYLENRLVMIYGQALAALSHEIADKLNWVLYERYGDLQVMAVAPVFRGDDRAAMRRYLASLQLAHPAYAWLGVTDASGRLVAATESPSGRDDRSGAAWFRAVRDCLCIRVLDAAPGEEVGGALVVTFAAPLRGARGEFLGTVVTMVSLDRLEDALGPVRVAFEADREAPTSLLEYQFVRSDGVLVADSRLREEGTVNVMSAALRSATMGVSDQEIFPGYAEERHERRGIEVVTGYARMRAVSALGGPRWLILVRVDRDDVLDSVRRTTKVVAAGGAVVIAPLLGLLAWSLVRVRTTFGEAQTEAERARTAESQVVEQSKALKEAEARHRLLLESASEGIIGVDADGRCMFINDAGAALLAGRREDCIGQDAHGLIHRASEQGSPECGDACALRHALRAGGSSAAQEDRLVRADGSELSIEYCTASLVVDGRVHGTVVIFHDTTERKLAEAEFLAHLRQLQNVVDLGHQALAGADMDDLMRDAVARAASAVDVPYGEIVTVQPGGTTWCVRAGVGWREGYVGRTMAAGDVDPAIITLLCSEEADGISGDARDEVSFQGTPMLRDHGVVSGVRVAIRGMDRAWGVLGVYADRRCVFTREDRHYLQVVANVLASAMDRRQAGEKLRLQTAALEAAADGVVITDRNGAIVWGNPAFMALTGYSAEEVIGRNLRLLKSGLQDPSFYADLWNTITSGRSWHGELVNKRKDGSLYTEEESITPVRDARGEASHFIAIKRDITGRKNLEAQLRQSQKMEAIGSLAGGIAHDFNNMLTVILGYSGLALAAMAADDPQRDNLNQVKEAGQRAATLTRQLLAFSRKQVLQSRVLDLNAVVANMDKMLQRLIGENIALVTALTPGLGHVKADAGQLEQVIMNLAVNARDAMPQGGKLTIETTNVELDDAFARAHIGSRLGPSVMLAVSDTGCGMDAATQARIFEPFFTTKEKGKGTGLGLATVYGIVKQSGGSIWVYSEVGVGTTVTVHLPCVEEALDAVGPSLSPADDLRGSEIVLLAEDEAGVRALACAVLRARGYQVLEAPSGEDAVQLSSAHDGVIHLLVTDMVMTGMSGRELAERLRTARPEMKVLIMSGYTDQAIARNGFLEGGTVFLQKPFTPLVLLQKVREVLGSPNTPRDSL